MAKNYPGPYEIELHYDVDGEEHVARYNCDVVTAPTPGQDPATINLATRDGAGIFLSVAVNEWVNLLKARFDTGTNFAFYNFYSIAPLSTVRTFITTGTLNVAGTSVSSPRLAGQMTYTFRTAEGNTMKIVTLESVDISDIRVPYAGTGAGNQAIMDYVIASDTWFLARDTSCPIAAMNVVGGQNEAVFRSRYR